MASPIEEESISVNSVFDQLNINEMASLSLRFKEF
jgi:hypothetical protein